MSILSVAWPARATSSTVEVVVPSHLRIGNQQFDVSVSGLRSYLETTKLTEPALYAQLAPDLERLEARQTNAAAVFAVGAAAGVVSTIVAFAGRSDCSDPSITDPNFGAKVAEWGNCNDRNMQHMMVFTLLGAGALVAGGIAAAVMLPKRSDVMDVVNKHNRISPDPLQFELGYDPSHQYAFAGASVVF
jgi:hypothetical protein